MMLVLLIGLFVSTVSADVVKFRVNENTGEVWLEQPPIGRLITSTELEAISTPGKKVPTDLKQAPFRHQGFWWLTPVQTYSEVVVYDNTSNKLEWKTELGEVLSQQELAYYKILLIVVILITGLFNFYYWRSRKYSEQIFLLAAILALLAALLAATVTAVAAAILATVVAIVAIVEYEETIPSTTVGTKRNITYWGCVAIFYLLAIVALFI